MKNVRYIKFGVAILFFALIFGKICYEYGYADAIEFYPSEMMDSLYIMAAYALVYVFICICQGWGDTSRRTNICCTLFLTLPYIALIIYAFAGDGEITELFFPVLFFVIFGIATLMELGILVFTEIQDRVLARRVKAKN